MLQIAVVRETDAKGPFSSTVLAVVVVKDVLLFICLAMNLEFANMVGSCSGCCLSHLRRAQLMQAAACCYSLPASAVV